MFIKTLKTQHLYLFPGLSTNRTKNMAAFPIPRFRRKTINSPTPSNQQGDNHQASKIIQFHQYSEAPQGLRVNTFISY
jgi:hypothetical protein